MCIGLHVKYLLFLSVCDETWKFSTVSRKNTPISNFMTIHPVGAEFPADGRTDMTKLIVCFRKFAKAPENELHEITSFIFDALVVWRKLLLP
jgi:hypothetical protein